jgi:hypothetical protein
MGNLKGFAYTRLNRGLLYYRLGKDFFLSSGCLEETYLLSEGFEVFHFNDAITFWKKSS